MATLEKAAATTPDMVVGKRATSIEIDVLNKMFSRDPTMALHTPESIGISRLNGGYSASLITNGFGWVSCLGGVEGYSGERRGIVLYFPYDFVSSEEIEKWCGFMCEKLGYQVRYIGAGYCGLLAWYGSGVSGQLKTHFIALDYQSDLYSTASKAILSKVTMLRYLYRPYHLKLIIHPIYEMVEAGLNPYDALFLAHYYAFAFGLDRNGYASERGLFFHRDPYCVPAIYPRSYNNVKQFFKVNNYINQVWSPFYLINGCFTYSSFVGPTFLTSNSYLDVKHPFGNYTSIHKYFNDPHATYFGKKFKSLLLAKEWVKAFDHYKAFLIEAEGVIKICWENYGSIRSVFRKFDINSAGEAGSRFFLKESIDFINEIKTK